MMKRNFARDVLIGVAVGDALGVPVEFVPRKGLVNEPVTGMRAWGTHNQAAGTWSDDSSLSFCLAEMLCKGYDLNDLAARFVNWKEYAYWTAGNKVFDIGIATSAAIYALERGITPVLAGGTAEESNGNGSLMRILPLLFYIKDKEINERFRIVKEVSSLTHGHIRSVMACFIYLELALELYHGFDKREALSIATYRVNDFFKETSLCPPEEVDRFYRILGNTVGRYEPEYLQDCGEDRIHSSGYVVNTLEASIWCLLKTDNYSEAVLKAVNLGHDTDTTAAVAGGLAGLLYGTENIPEAWLDVLARRQDIENLAERLHSKLF